MTECKTCNGGDRIIDMEISTVDPTKLKPVYELWQQMGVIYDKCIICGTKDGITAHPFVEEKMNLTKENRYMICPNCKIDKRSKPFKDGQEQATRIFDIYVEYGQGTIRQLTTALRRNISVLELL